MIVPSTLIKGIAMVNLVVASYSIQRRFWSHSLAASGNYFSSPPPSPNTAIGDLRY